MTLSPRLLANIGKRAESVARHAREIQGALITFKGDPNRDKPFVHEAGLLRVSGTGLAEMFNQLPELRISEKVKAAREFEEKVAERRGRPGKKKENIPQCIAELPTGEETREWAAKKAGLGNRETYRLAALVVDNGCPELIAAMDDETLSIPAAERLARLPHAEQRRELG